MKIPEISYDTQYDDDTEGNILHELAAHKFTPFFYRKYYMGKNYNEEANQRDFMNNSPLDIASDMKNWTMFRLLIKLKLTDDTIVHAIGELFSHYLHVGSFYIDEFIFRLILKKGGYFNKEECAYLLGRAFDGMAWPYIYPLLPYTQEPIQCIDKYFHYIIADEKNLKLALKTRLINEKLNRCKDYHIFSCHDDGLHIRIPKSHEQNAYFNSKFISEHRRKISKEMKHQARKWEVSFKLIKQMLSLYTVKNSVND